MFHRERAYTARLLCGAAASSILIFSGAAYAQERAGIEIASQPLSKALGEFAAQTKQAVLVTPALTNQKVSAPVSGAATPEAALTAMLAGTGLTYRRDGDTFLVVQDGSGPQSQSAAGGGAEVEALVVTAQKREERIQDVPIAISAFSAKALEEQKIEGGFDLLKAIPNVTFSKSNFTSYNFSIRGVGTKAISATTDPGVAVAFNNTTIIQNRLFEQEYFDVERVEVLRGPQGTLYGRNATSGVINLISAKPKLNDFEGSIKAEIGNYDTKRLVGMLNIPIVEDMLAVRLAGAVTNRSGYDFNEVTGNAVNGRELWSGRVTVGFEPFERLRANLLWEHFEEDDNRSRTGKQLCTRDPGPEFIGGTNVEGSQGGFNIFPATVRRAMFTQGCLPGNLYADAAFGKPNGLALPFMMAPVAVRFDLGRINGETVYPTKSIDPYGDAVQSRDLRTIESIRDPIYRASADLFQLDFTLDLTPSLTFISQTAYVEDETFSFQDYNRFSSVPIFQDTSLLTNFGGDWRTLSPRPEGSPVGTPGVFCDPQIGCSDRLAGFDISQASATQFNQEFRLQSNFDGPVNFSIGANYTKFETLVDYYVMFNLITVLASTSPFNILNAGQAFTPGLCYTSGGYFGFETGYPINTPVPTDHPLSNCVYVDPNPVDFSKNFEGDGHNYFRSKNPYKLDSRAAFGEVYWNVQDDLKVTAGLRYTKDKKTFIPVPSQVLMAPTGWAGGTASAGYPEDPPIVQEWGEWTGRLGLDWQPDLPFTDETLLYAFYSRGYKGGGANPPSPGYATLEDLYVLAAEAGIEDPVAYVDALTEPGLFYTRGQYPVLTLTAVEYGPTFDPEFVDAFEVGAKNTLLGGAMTFNATAFFYDYKDYQISQIRDRTAVNENFDAKMWGLEFETVFAPSRDLQIIANLGYLDTEVAEGETSIDTMNRTQGNPNYVVVKPWLQLPSNCVVPVHIAERWLANSSNGLTGWHRLCGAGVRGLVDSSIAFGVDTPDTVLGGPWNVFNYPELNGGAGLRADLGGNEMPNAPHWTANIGIQHGVDFFDGSWRATVRGDAYWQSQSYHRIYNLEPYDKLHGWYNLNLSMWVEQPDLGLKIEFYVKNVLDDSPITDAFLNSDDTLLTTNVFTLDPRLIGLNIRKTF